MERRLLMDNKENSLATELLQELKASATRWFIAFVLMVVLEISTIGVFIWYIQLPIEESTTTEQIVDDVDLDRSTVNQNIGGE